jgi:hypothetical protein
MEGHSPLRRRVGLLPGGLLERHPQLVRESRCRAEVAGVLKSPAQSVAQGALRAKRICHFVNVTAFHGRASGLRPSI